AHVQLSHVSKPVVIPLTTLFPAVMVQYSRGMDVVMGHIWLMDIVDMLKLLDARVTLMTTL
ncbi:hypothetical protein, partial [Salmonella sp. s54925]|uniref:hypothetical protein n=1 Tax=Salmonella sp. s54925 TaxID=3159674 RepID=UPI00397EDEE4